MQKNFGNTFRRNYGSHETMADANCDCMQRFILSRDQKKDVQFNTP